LSIHPLLLVCALGLVAAPRAASGACFQGDTDGDGIVDTACEVIDFSGGPSGIEITHPNTGAKSFYSVPAGASFAINSLADTDAQPGVEVVVVVAANGNGPSGIEVINDRLRVQRSYDMPRGASFAINSVRDTDGVAGAEIVLVVVANGNGPDQVRVIHDAQAFQRSYDMPQGSSFAINTVQDTDGNPGAEIVLVVITNGNGPNQVRVIQDARAFQRSYDMPQGSSFAINTVQDTDGVAGAEIVVVLNNPFSIQVLHDRTATANTYSIGSFYSILAVRDYDGSRGAEICYNRSNQFFLITDRTRSTTPRAGC
jgi:hypothetical protein